MTEALPEREALRFMARFAADRAAGIGRTLEDYQRLFPACPERVAVEYARALRDEDTGSETLWEVADSVEEPVPQIGRFQIIGELGRGGQSVVYLAKDARLPRHVALKVLRRGFGTTNEDQLERFRREAAVTARLDHPGICSVLDMGSESGVTWIAMRHVEGETLSARIARWRAEAPSVGSQAARLRVMEALTLIEQAARALHAAHEAGVVHRDIKPGNIMVDRAGRPVILDFGLARDDESTHATLTRTEDVFGTPSYMAPEHFLGDRRMIDRRTDVYALGVALFEAVTLQRPFEAPTRAALFEAIQRRDPPDPRRLNPLVGTDLRSVMETCLEKAPDRRYQTALDLADDLLRVRERRPVRARPVTVWTRVRRFCQRDPWLATATASALLLLVGGLVVSTALLARARREAREKEAALLGYAQIADPALMESLTRQAALLWPRRAERIFDMDSWLATARPLTERIGLRVADLSALDAAPAPDDPSWGQRHRALDALARGASAFRDLVADVERRRAFSTDLRRRSVEEEADAWTQCLAALGADGIVMEPQVGLIPLGRDRHSSRWEFWHLGSGSRPAWEGEFLSGSAKLAPGSGLVLVLLPGGTFLMGGQRGDADAPNWDRLANNREGPVHEVTLDPFFLSKYEMTQGQWRRFTGGNPSQHFPETAAPPSGEAADLHPVGMVTWNEAMREVARLGLTLPTEAQWEYACRAGSQTTYATGSEPGSLRGFANIADEGSRPQWPGADLEPGFADGWTGHAPVGTYEANPFGLHDMNGNVGEWCRDGFETYRDHPPAPGDGLRGGEDLAYRVVRGGSFYDLASKSRAAFRGAWSPDQKEYDSGLRPARPVER